MSTMSLLWLVCVLVTYFATEALASAPAGLYAAGALGGLVAIMQIIPSTDEVWAESRVRFAVSCGLFAAGILQISERGASTCLLSGLLVTGFVFGMSFIYRISIPKPAR